jgi:hypothetical protein
MTDSATGRCRTLAHSWRASGSGWTIDSARQVSNDEEDGGDNDAYQSSTTSTTGWRATLKVAYFRQNRENAMFRMRRNTVLKGVRRRHRFSISTLTSLGIFLG